MKLSYLDPCAHLTYWKSYWPIVMKQLYFTPPFIWAANKKRQIRGQIWVAIEVATRLRIKASSTIKSHMGATNFGTPYNTIHMVSSFISNNEVSFQFLFFVFYNNLNDCQPPTRLATLLPSKTLVITLVTQFVLLGNIDSLNIFLFLLVPILFSYIMFFSSYQNFSLYCQIHPYNRVCFLFYLSSYRIFYAHIGSLLF